MEFLYSLGAIDANGRLTSELGVKMAEVSLDCKIGDRWLMHYSQLPVDPAMAKIVRDRFLSIVGSPTDFDPRSCSDPQTSVAVKRF